VTSGKEDDNDDDSELFSCIKLKLYRARNQ